MRYNNISLKTYKNPMRELKVEVEKTVSNVLPAKFSLIFDGKTTLDTHYVAFFATYSTIDKCGYLLVCLEISTLDNEDSKGADEHFFVMKFVLPVYGNILGNVVAVFSDN